ncbi:helix-turn-helix domain-containing protein [Streptomyces sp. NPDC060010]|uniref:helix-turn-helix domain-containing protein n=1 Tax=Streptomyces sp. NPDC060010 TaxID=3347036 RepID=UPI0036994C21
MPLPDDDHTGSRIREQRRLARLTQRELADRIPYSLSLLNQVECGARPASLRFLAEARKVAPEQTRHLPGTRATIRGLVHMSRRAPDSLGGMARWVGL